ncbi:MAG: hypothetical protein M1817_000506 [Caeruleum heppii]|nr:MAG: hypothetical protein M1817_000506 [Caeruleum heppii]
MSFPLVWRLTIDNNTSTQASGRQIRATVADMFRHLDQEDTDRSPHPCADRWAVLYISNDGQRLALEPHNDDSCPSERLEAGEGDPLDREEYQHDLEQLERVIRKLLLEYETPHPFVPNSDVDQLSDVSDCVPLERVPDAVVAEQISKPTSSTPPWEFEVRTSTDDAGTFQPGSDSSQSRLSSTTPEAVCQRRQESPSALDVMLQAALENRYTALDFPGANYYWSALDRLHRLSLGQHRVSRWLLGRMSSSYRRSLCKLSQSLKKIEAKVAGLRDSHQRIDLAVSGLSNRIRDLRDTMWFVTDVRHSAEYEEVSNLTAALKKMGHSSVSSHGRFVASRPRSLTKPIVNQFLNKSDAQTIDVLTAAPDQGGYKKLSDDQSERTRKWLEGRGIEIFCKGEERIHRFCMEIDKCVNKLVGPGILESPVLWSSDLFMKERELLDSGTSRAERFLAGVDVQGPDDIQHWGDVNRATSEPSGQHKREKTVLVGDPRVGTPTGPSPPAIARSWYNVPGHMDRSARDFRGRSGPSTPLSSIDTSKLFWSPFMDDSQSPKKEGRPHADSILDLSRGVQKGTRVNVSVEKHHFLLALKRRLTSLLLSDLGGSLWSNGSETDGWFFGELGDECVRRKRCTDQTVEQGALGVQGGRQLSDQGWTSSGDEGGARGAGTVPRTIPSSKPASASSIDQVVKGNLSLGGKRIQPGHRPYPFAAAYRVSMHKFTVLPDPLAKLDALYELHLLISASLSGPVSTGAPSPSQASALRCAPTHSTNTQEGLNPAASHSIYSEGEAKALASASHAAALIDRSPASTTGSKPRQGPSDVRSDSGATDQVVKVLRDLFHADIMRPRTLFRDLQFIAAFVPTAILNDTPRGKAFWDAGLAASGLKQEVCQTMVEIADGIVASHTHARSLSPTRTRVGSGEVSERASGRLGMREAGRMWSITAKEGDAVAQRELAIFYLTHPELVERTTLPLSRPKDVFKAYVMDEGRHEDPMRSDPATMCVAYHWMELSSKGGDDLANQYLKSREELNALP